MLYGVFQMSQNISEKAQVKYEKQQLYVACIYINIYQYLSIYLSIYSSILCMYVGMYVCRYVGM